MKTNVNNLPTPHALRGCVTGELVLRKVGFKPWDHDRARFTADGVEIYPGMVVLFNPELTLSSQVDGFTTPEYSESHVGRWCVPTQRVVTLTFDECAS